MIGNPLGNYIEEMRLRRDPPPSWNYMSNAAGLSPSQIGQIVKGKIKKPTSDTLRKIARRWGTPEDEEELIRLAGHPLSADDEQERSQEELKSEAIETFIRRFESLPRRYQEHLIFQARSLWLAYMAENRGITPDEQDPDQLNGLAGADPLNI